MSLLELQQDVNRLAICLRTRNAAEWARLLLELRSRLTPEDYRRVRLKAYAVSLSDAGGVK